MKFQHFLPLIVAPITLLACEMKPTDHGQTLTNSSQVQEPQVNVEVALQKLYGFDEKWRPRKGHSKFYVSEQFRPLNPREEFPDWPGLMNAKKGSYYEAARVLPRTDANKLTVVLLLNLKFDFEDGERSYTIVEHDEWDWSDPENVVLRVAHERGSGIKTPDQLQALIDMNTTDKEFFDKDLYATHPTAKFHHQTAMTLTSKIPFDCKRAKLDPERKDCLLLIEQDIYIDELHNNRKDAADYYWNLIKDKETGEVQKISHKSFDMPFGYISSSSDPSAVDSVVKERPSPELLGKVCHFESCKGN